MFIYTAEGFIIGTVFLRTTVQDIPFTCSYAAKMSCSSPDNF